MLYYFYEWNHAMLAPLRAAADVTRIAYQNPLNPMSRTTVGRAIAAGAELFERTTRVYAKPGFGIDETIVNNAHVKVEEKVVVDKPFCELRHFERQLPKDRKADPRFLIVAPLSGHHATLLRGTVEALLPYADVYITDWKDARTVPLEDGKFDLDDYTQYVIDFLQFLGPDSHVLGVCQPSVPVMMAVAHMEKHGDDCYPATMTLMGGPIDTRVNPTAVNRLAQEKGIDWFRENVIMTVPFPQPGFRRRVYPGFLQLTGFMSMNLDRHMTAHKDFFWQLVKDDGDSAEKHRSFYDEYNAVMDMTAEFYLQTVEEVFIKHALPKGTITFKGETIDLTAIKRVALLTVEGENDDISGVGQTEAAQDMCPNIPEDMRVHYVQPKVGHYGVFNGSRFRSEIVPRIIDFALTHGTTHGTANLPKKTEITKREGRNFGAHAERRAKAKELGQKLGAGGETGIADPLMFESNPFAAGERMIRAFAEPAEEAIAQTMRSRRSETKSTEASTSPRPAAKKAEPEKPSPKSKDDAPKTETAKAEAAPSATKTSEPAKAKSEADKSNAKSSEPTAKSADTAKTSSTEAKTKAGEAEPSKTAKTEPKAKDQPANADAKASADSSSQSAASPKAEARSSDTKTSNAKNSETQASGTKSSAAKTSGTQGSDAKASNATSSGKTGSNTANGSAKANASDGKSSVAANSNGPASAQGAFELDADEKASKATSEEPKKGAASGATAQKASDAASTSSGASKAPAKAETTATATKRSSTPARRQSSGAGKNRRSGRTTNRGK